MAFPVGRHVYGYEVQTAIAAVDWLSRKGAVSIYGRGEGAYVATYTAALDPRIAQVDVEGFSLETPPLWKQPLYRNVFGLLKDFGDAQFAAMLAGRAARLPVAPAAQTLPSPDPEYPGPPDAGLHAAPDRALRTVARQALERGRRAGRRQALRRGRARRAPRRTHRR